jgi:hypothetical protein
MHILAAFALGMQAIVRMKVNEQKLEQLKDELTRPVHLMGVVSAWLPRNQ